MNFLSDPALRHVAYWSFLQAAASTVMIFLFGVLVAVGLVGLEDSTFRRRCSFLFCLPNFMPVLFAVMSYLVWVKKLGFNLQGGFWAVVVTHTLINAGFAGVLLADQLGRGFSGAIELAAIEGASKIRIWLAVLSSNRNQIGKMLLGFFGLCFTSFSVPLILGSDRVYSFEVLAFRYLSFSGDLFKAVSISGLQMAFFALLALSLSGITSDFDRTLKGIDKHWGNRGFLFFGFILTFAALVGIFLNLNWSIENGTKLYPYLPKLISSTALNALIAGGLSGAFYLMVGYFYLKPGLRKVLQGFGFLSPVLVGLVFYVLEAPIFLKIVGGLVIVFFPTIFRLLGQGHADLIVDDLKSARILGASNFKAFIEVSGPRLLPPALQIAAITGFWAAGDYSYSSIVTGEISNLALLARNLLGGYRIEMGSMVVLLILLVGGCVFGFYWSLARVYRQKLIS